MSSPSSKRAAAKTDEQVKKRAKNNNKNIQANQANLTQFFAVASGTSKKSKKGAVEGGSTNPVLVDENDKKIQAIKKTTPKQEGDENSSAFSLLPPPDDPIMPTLVSTPSGVTWSTYKDTVIYRKAKEDPRTGVAAFDLDGTLLVWRTSGWPSNLNDYELWSMEAVNKLRQLHDDGYKLLLVSNQGSIRKAFDGKKAKRVKSLIDWFAKLVDRPMCAVMSTNSPKTAGDASYHKPNPRLWAVAEKLCNKGVAFSISDSFFVGDSIISDDDPQGGVDERFAAEVGAANGGVELKFYSPESYFGPNSLDRRKKKGVLLNYEKPPLHACQARAALLGRYLTGPLLLVMGGVQGSGKSTFCNRLQEKGWVVLSQDTINNGKPGKREKVESAATAALKENKCVAIDRTHLNPEQRAHFVKVGKDCQIPIHTIFLKADKDVIAKRVKERTNHPGKVQGESGARLAVASISKIVLPQYKEGFDLIHVCHTGEGAALLAKRYGEVGKNVLDGEESPIRFKLADGSNLPSVGLGTMGISLKKVPDVLTTAIHLDFVLIDTAPTYKNENAIGVAFGKESSTRFVVGKVPKRATDASQVRKELNTSLKNLNRASIDLFLLHWPCDVMTRNSLKEVWHEMERCLEEGLVKSLGVCNFNIEALSALLAVCNKPPVVNQVERHPLLPQWELMDFCALHSIILQAHTPLGHGDLLKNPDISEAAKRSQFSQARVLLHWNLQHGVAVVPKASTREHLEDVKCCEGQAGLEPGTMKALDSIEKRHRYVAPPFMYGTEGFHWAKRRPTH